jgi:hypothetical protein
VDRSLRQLGQVLVVMGALLGAMLGVGLALIVENAESPRPIAAAGQERGAVLAAHPPSSQPPASTAASSGGQAEGSAASSSQRVESANRADGRAGKAHKHGEDRRDKPSRGSDKPGKGKGKGEGKGK